MDVGKGTGTLDEALRELVDNMEDTWYIQHRQGYYTIAFNWNVFADKHMKIKGSYPTADLRKSVSIMY